LISPCCLKGEKESLSKKRSRNFNTPLGKKTGKKGGETKRRDSKGQNNVTGLGGVGKGRNSINGAGKRLLVGGGL